MHCNHWILLVDEGEVCYNLGLGASVMVEALLESSSA